MDSMLTDDGSLDVPSSHQLSDPPPPGTTFSSTNILQELSKFEPFDETTSSWPDYAQRLQEHFDFYNTPADKRVRIFIDRISNATYEKLRGICKPVAPRDKPLDELWKIMDRYFNRYWNIPKERVKFIRRHQRAHENILRYATELKRWSKNCRFPESWWQEALVTQFLNGLRSEVIRKKLMDFEEKDFDQMVDFACNAEAMQANFITVADEAGVENATEAASSTDVGERSDEAPTSNAMEVDTSSDVIVCYNCFEPGHKSPACELKKKKVPAAKNTNVNQNHTVRVRNRVRKVNKNLTTNQNETQPPNEKKNQVKNPSKNQWTNKSKNQVKKQNANKLKFQNKNQFRNQNKSQSRPFISFSNQLGGQFDYNIRDVLRNQYKDPPAKEYSNQYYSNGYSNTYSNTASSSTYKPNNSSFYR